VFGLSVKASKGSAPCSLAVFGLSKNEKKEQFFKLKMAAPVMLDSGHQAFFDAKDEFLFKVATFLQNLMKIG